MRHRLDVAVRQITEAAGLAIDVSLAPHCSTIRDLRRLKYREAFYISAVPYACVSGTRVDRFVACFIEVARLLASRSAAII